MNLKEFLTLADELVFAQTGKHLDDLQQDILQGTLQGKKYSEIADEYKCTDGHVRDVASQLWKIISQELGEDVGKKNFRSTMERLLFSNVSHFGKDFVQIGKYNVCGDVSSPQEPLKRLLRNNPKPRVYLDLGAAPSAGVFYGRTEELATLEQWIVREKCRLVAILGMSGIGKTALAVELVERVKAEFDYVIWRSLLYFPCLEALEASLLELFGAEAQLRTGAEAQLRTGAEAQLRTYLRQYRCLIILDDVQNIFCSGKLAGEYQPGYEDYGSLFKMIGEVDHNSCLVLNSWEPPREIIKLAGENTPVRLFQLDGLGKAATEILREKGLVDSEQWSSLIDTYRGNPLWLKTVATMILDLFSGRVARYLKYDILCEDLEEILNRQFQRLSELEKQVMSWVGASEQSVSLCQLLESSQLSPSPVELLNAMQSLTRRGLIEKTEGEETLFRVAPVWREYLSLKVL